MALAVCAPRPPKPQPSQFPSLSLSSSPHQAQSPESLSQAKTKTLKRRFSPISSLATPLFSLSALFPNPQKIPKFSLFLLQTLKKSSPHVEWDTQPLSEMRDLCDPYLSLFNGIVTPEVSPILGGLLLGMLGQVSKQIYNSKLLVPERKVDIELNTHRCWYDFNGNCKAGFGGVLGDLLEFCGATNSESSLEAELWAIYRGLNIVLATGMHNVKILSDSLPAVKLINEGPPRGHRNRALIADSKKLLDRTRSMLKYICPEANQSAQYLARLGAEQAKKLVLSCIKM